MELSASDKKLNEIVLKEDTEMLDEVVVVGYGAAKKSDLTVFSESRFSSLI